MAVLQSGYSVRVLIGLTAVPLPVVFTLLYMLPESPYYLHAAGTHFMDSTCAATDCVRAVDQNGWCGQLGGFEM